MPMNPKHLALSVALYASAASVFAQWQWIDESGHKVFSDRPPPAHISPKQILKQPSSAHANGTHSASGAAVLYPSADNPQLSAAAATAQSQAAQEAKDAAAKTQALAQQEQAKQLAEQEAKEKAADAARQKAEEAELQKLEAQQTKARQENCQRARTALASLQSGGLQGHVNEKGERGFMTESQRQAELQRVQQVIQNSCK